MAASNTSLLLARAPVCEAAAWAASVWQRTNAAGAVTEWWYHIPTSTWHIVQRSTLTDEQIGTAVPA